MGLKYSFYDACIYVLIKMITFIKALRKESTYTFSYQILHFLRHAVNV